jgi:hypothetical protein
MKAFLGNPKIKAKYLARLTAHAKGDEIVKGKYWENGKGCAVGCTIHSSDHMAYETELGIPVMLAKLEDEIFENLPNGTAMEWPFRFLSAINIGVDLSMVGSQFLYWLLMDKKDGVIRFSNKKTRASIIMVGDLYKQRLNGNEPNQTTWNAARDAAREAAGYTWAAIWATKDAARASAWASFWASRGAVRSAARGAARDSHPDATRDAHHEKMGDKLIELIEAC